MVYYKAFFLVFLNLCSQAFDFSCASILTVCLMCNSLTILYAIYDLLNPAINSYLKQCWWYAKFGTDAVLNDLGQWRTSKSPPWCCPLSKVTKGFSCSTSNSTKSWEWTWWSYYQLSQSERGTRHVERKAKGFNLLLIGIIGNFYILQIFCCCWLWIAKENIFPAVN